MSDTRVIFQAAVGGMLSLGYVYFPDAASPALFLFLPFLSLSLALYLLRLSGHLRVLESLVGARADAQHDAADDAPRRS